MTTLFCKRYRLQNIYHKKFVNTSVHKNQRRKMMQRNGLVESAWRCEAHQKKGLDSLALRLWSPFVSPS